MWKKTAEGAHPSGGSVLGAWLRSLWSSWASDRPRPSPREGRLLRLRPAWILRVDGVSWEVRSRSVGETPGGPYVLYHCGNASGTALLKLEPEGFSSRYALRWSEGGSERFLDEDAVEVFPWPGPPSPE